MLLKMPPSVKTQTCSKENLSGCVDNQKPELTKIEKDEKVKLASEQIKIWVNKGQSPIVFCRFIATAHYVAKILKSVLPKEVDVRAITSELSDDERREKIDEMAKSPKRILVATDCLSEGINLQDKFNAILHYDLPWNPNRLEQRMGRVHRYGQKFEVFVYNLIAQDTIEGRIFKSMKLDQDQHWMSLHQDLHCLNQE